MSDARQQVLRSLAASIEGACERGMRLDGLWWSRRLGGWAVDVSGIDALIVAPDLQDALMLAVSRVDEVRGG